MFGNEVLLARWWFGENLDGASDGALIKRNALWDVACSERGMSRHRKFLSSADCETEKKCFCW